MDMVARSDSDPDSTTKWNYLGLEIRPLVAQYARERIPSQAQGRLDFLGCNVNVDLDRLLTQYRTAAQMVLSEDSSNTTPYYPLQRISIQFPDPHFKSSHAKRRVVTPSLVQVLAKHLAPGTGQVLLQSDIQSVLDDMRAQFHLFNENHEEAIHYFDDALPLNEYLSENPLGVPTEREVSVLERGLPVYRALLTRTNVPYRESPITTQESNPNRV